MEQSQAAPLVRQRLLMVAAQRKRSRVFKMAVWLPIAAAFVATTAWAGATGRFAAAVHLLSHVVMGEASVPSSGRPLQHADGSGAGAPTESLSSEEPTSIEPVAPQPGSPSSRLQRPWSSPLVRWQPPHRTPHFACGTPVEPFARGAGCVRGAQLRAGRGRKRGYRRGASPLRAGSRRSRPTRVPSGARPPFQAGRLRGGARRVGSHLRTPPPGDLPPKPDGTER